MLVEKTFIKDLLILNPKVFKDNRGYFFESFNNLLIKELNSEISFCQDNESFSEKGILRGLHFQKKPYDQTKLVRCVTGEIFDVAVDLRLGSKTFGNHYGLFLSSENKKQLLIPKGFAHGFLVISNHAIVNYKVDNYYSKQSESGIFWNSKNLGIEWPLNYSEIKVNERDSLFPEFKKTNVYD